MKTKRNDDELARLLTRAYDERLDEAEAAEKAAAEAPVLPLPMEELRAAAAREREQAAGPKERKPLRAEASRRAWLMPAVAALLALAILGGCFLLLRGRLHRKASGQPTEPTLTVPEEGTLTRQQIRDRAEHPEQYADELIFDDYLGAVQRCLVFRGSYGFCCVIRDVSDAGRFYGVFLFDQDGRLTETPEGRAVAMPEGEALEAKVLGRPLDAAVAEYGEPLFDAGSGFYIPAWFTEDGRVVCLRGVDDVSDPVAKIETRYVLTEGSLPVQTDRLTDEQLGEIFNKAVEDGDLDALVREYQGVVIRQTEYFNSAADRTALFYGKTKLLLVSEEQTEAGKTKLSRYFLPLSASAASFDGVRPGTDLEGVQKLDPDGGVYPFTASAAPAGSWYSSHYTEDGWLIRIQYESAPEDKAGDHGGLAVKSVARTHLAWVYTDWSQPPEEDENPAPGQTVRRTDDELWTILEKVEEEKPSYETVIDRYQPAHLDGTQAAEVLGYAVNGVDDPVRICFLYGETRQLIIVWNVPDEKDAGPVCSSGPLSRPKMVFDSVREGTSLDAVREMDPNAIYPLEHTGGRVPQYSTHFTEDGWVIRVDYDETQTGFTVRTVTRTRVALVYNDVTELEVDRGDPAQTAVRFLTLTARNEYLYEEDAVEELTVAAVPEEVRQGIKVYDDEYEPYTELRRQQDLPIGDHADYLLEKQAQIAQNRQEQGIMRSDFRQYYTCEGTVIAEGVARICVREVLTFTYTYTYPSDTPPSALEVLHEVFLYEHDGEWYVFDVFSDDGYDSAHKADLSQAGE